MMRIPSDIWPRSSSVRVSKKLRAFTLIELLIAVAIIAILALLGSGVVLRSREMASRQKCTNNLRQIGVAFNLYAADHNGLSVKGRDYSDWVSGPDGGYPFSWVSHLNTYLNDGVRYDGTSKTTSPAFQCPAGPNEVWNCTNYLGNIFLGGFRDPEFNQRTNMPDIYSPRRLNACQSPSKVVIIIDADTKATGYLDFEIWERTGLKQQLKARHGGKGNMLFADGHVEAWNPDEIPAALVQNYFPWYNADDTEIWPPIR